MILVREVEKVGIVHHEIYTWAKNEIFGFAFHCSGKGNSTIEPVETISFCL